MRSRSPAEMEAFKRTCNDRILYIQRKAADLEKDLDWWIWKKQNIFEAADDFCDECGKEGTYRQCCYMGHG